MIRLSAGEDKGVQALSSNHLTPKHSPSCSSLVKGPDSISKAASEYLNLLERLRQSEKLSEDLRVQYQAEKHQNTTLLRQSNNILGELETQNLALTLEKKQHLALQTTLGDKSAELKRVQSQLLISTVDNEKEPMRETGLLQQFEELWTSARDKEDELSEAMFSAFVEYSAISRRSGDPNRAREEESLPCHRAAQGKRHEKSRSDIAISDIAASTQTTTIRSLESEAQQLRDKLHSVSERNDTLVRENMEMRSLQAIIDKSRADGEELRSENLALRNEIAEEASAIKKLENQARKNDTRWTSSRREIAALKAAGKTAEEDAVGPGTSRDESNALDGNHVQPHEVYTSRSAKRRTVESHPAGGASHGGLRIATIVVRIL
ncbi:hypothetical protein P7C73_g4137, partial [Tremellales sp. Uapishka_1]